MSLINEFRSIEETIRELEARRSSLKEDPKLQTELEFETKLKELMATYTKSLGDVIAILDPHASAAKAPKGFTGKQGHRAPRQVKVFKNPHTGEVVETKGGNHKTLKDWKAEHGKAAVLSWQQA